MISPKQPVEPEILDPAEYALCYAVAGPHWADLCGHDGYVGTVWPVVHSKAGSRREIIDVYVFEQSNLGQTICLRYGDEEASQYHSPGSIEGLIEFAGRLESWKAALGLLKSRGNIAWKAIPTFLNPDDPVLVIPPGKLFNPDLGKSESLDPAEVITVTVSL